MKMDPRTLDELGMLKPRLDDLGNYGLLERAIDALRQSMNTGLSASALMSAQSVINDYEQTRRR